MGYTFTIPPHPSETVLEASSDSQVHSLVLTDQPQPRDPHQLPDFDSKGFTASEAPVLYLPPLLSSPPKPYPSLSVKGKNAPLVTETRLPDIDPASLSLHKALHHFRPLTADYASFPYAEAFNWSELVLPEDVEREWYCVVFRSKRKLGSDSGPLYDADREAHEEAVRNGGLILYWYGMPNPQTGMNLATCIWQSRNHAIAANSRPSHVQAMKLAVDSYEIYELERYVLRKSIGEKSVDIESFRGGNVGW